MDKTQHQLQWRTQSVYVLSNLNKYKICLNIYNIYIIHKGLYLLQEKNYYFLFYNIRKYAQLIFSELAKNFSIDKFRFIDSFQFMATSLDKLAKNLKKEDYLSLWLYE